MPFTKGQRANPRGRPKGAANKTTRVFKEMVTQCLEDIGGRTAMTKWAKANPTEFYKIAARLIPHEVVGNPDAPIPLSIELTDGPTTPPDAESGL